MVKRHPSQSHPWRGVITGCTWTKIGQYYVDSLDERDIVEVLNPEDDPDFKPQAATEPVCDCAPAPEDRSRYVIIWVDPVDGKEKLFPRLITQDEYDLAQQINGFCGKMKGLEFLKATH